EARKTPAELYFTSEETMPEFCFVTPWTKTNGPPAVIVSTLTVTPMSTAPPSNRDPPGAVKLPVYTLTLPPCPGSTTEAPPLVPEPFWLDEIVTLPSWP